MNKQQTRSFYDRSDKAITDQMISNKLMDLRIATLCVVTSVNTKKHTLNAQPVVMESIQQKNGAIYMPLPEFKNVPYFKGGNTPREGDVCVCITLDRSYEGYSSNKPTQQVNSNGSIHNISNCVAFVGFDINIDDEEG